MEVDGGGDNRRGPGEPGPQSYLLLTADPDAVASANESKMPETH